VWVKKCGPVVDSVCKCPYSGGMTETVTAQLTAFGVVEGQSYTLRKLTLEPVEGFGVRSVALVQDEDGYLYKVPNAHIVLGLSV
jgi:hypothetical protein